MKEFYSLQLDRDVWKKMYERQKEQLANLIDRGLHSQDYDEAMGVFYEMRDILKRDGAIGS